MAAHDAVDRSTDPPRSAGEVARIAALIVDVVRAGVRAEAVWLELAAPADRPASEAVVAGTRPGGPPTPLEALATARGREARVVTVDVPGGGSSYSDPIGRLTVLLDSGTTDRRPVLAAFARLAGAAVDQARELDRRGDPDLRPLAPLEDTDLPSGG